MKEIKDIIAAYGIAQNRGLQTALATVVHVAGSSYRRPGARMLITEEGELTGAISGGCLEGDALRKALLAMSRGKAMLVTYDTSDEDDAKLGMGLGCNGIIQVLIEPIVESDANNPIRLLQALASRRQPAVLVTLFSLENRQGLQPGTCLMVMHGGAITGEAPFLTEPLIAEANKVLAEQQSSFKKFSSGEGAITAFVEWVPPATNMVVIGAGNDVQPLVQIAGVLGWQTTVVDGRPAYARPERFAPTCQVLLATPETVLQQVTIDAQTVFVLMTHNYNYDMAILRELLKRNVTYIGMLGPKKKRQRMLDELAEAGETFTKEQLAVLHSPVGLDIGAETAEEIAVSIIAEIKSVLAGRKPAPLKEADDVIHAREATIILEVKLDSF